MKFTKISNSQIFYEKLVNIKEAIHMVTLILKLTDYNICTINIEYLILSLQHLGIRY